VLNLLPQSGCAFLGAGVGGVPIRIERPAEHCALTPEYVPNLKRKPSQVERSENFFIFCDPD